MSSWQTLTTQLELQEAISASDSRPCIILKHSTRCSLSSMAKSRLEKGFDQRFQYYIIDVIRHRDISDSVARVYGVEHESPQAFLLRDRKLLEVKSHLAISPSHFQAVLDVVD